MMKKLTIIIATYNAGEPLRQALDSIKYQTYKDIEVIVIDGNSTDNTVDIIKEYNDVVYNYISEPDTGIYNAFNKGINMATGDYIYFLGADDCLCDYYVIENIMNKINDVAVFSAPVKLIKEDLLKERIAKNILTKEEVLSGNMMPHQGLFVRSEVMKKYRFNENNRVVSDWEFLVRYLLDGGTISFTDVPVAFFCAGGASGSKFGSYEWKIQLSEQILALNNLAVDKKYIANAIDGAFNFRKRNSLGYHFVEFFKLILDKCYILNLSKAIEKILIKVTGFRRHKCNLKKCRWCKRNV